MSKKTKPKDTQKPEAGIAPPQQPAEESVTDAVQQEAEKQTADEAEKARRELEKLKDEMLRLRADFDNARKRIEKQKRDDLKYSSLPLMSELLTVVDNLELALKYAPEDDPLRQGVNLALGDMKKVLKNYHLEPIESLGKEFDPSLHEALSVTHDQAKGDNIIIAEQRVGYKLFDRVVRPSRVVVNKQPAVKAEETVG